MRAQALQLRIAELRALQLGFSLIGEGVELAVFVIYGNHGYETMVVGRRRFGLVVVKVPFYQARIDFVLGLDGFGVVML